ncbi:MAG: hypothetical protein ACI857_000139 [Arenicella sp.]|jgi:hypothetical protein
MRLIYFLPFAIIISCSSEPQKFDFGPAGTEPGTEDEILVNELDLYVPEDPTERKFDFSEMPRTWWLLTKRGEEFIRYNHWDAQDETIEFVVGKDGSDWMNIAYAHDSDQGDITEFTATLVEGEGISQVNGSFIFSSELEDQSRKVNFYWNQLKHYIEFENLLSEREYYVPDGELGYFIYEETFREED